MSPLLMDDDLDAPPVPRVVRSVAVNLASYACGKVNRHEDGSLSVPAALVADFWADGRVETGDEVVLLANMAGALDATDFDALAVALLGRLSGPRQARLATESELARERIRERVAELRGSVRRRRAYVEMLSEVWRVLQPAWEGPPGRRAERAVGRIEGMLANGRPWRSLAPTPRREQLLDQVFAETGHDLPVVLAPSVVMGSLFVLDVEDALVVGLPLPAAGAEDQADEMARQLKALAHPTRLAIIREVAERPATVGELARTFQLAQPTVTGHLRQLRDAGLLRRGEDAGRAYTIDRTVARELTDGLGELAGLGA